MLKRHGTVERPHQLAVPPTPGLPMLTGRGERIAIVLSAEIRRRRGGERIGSKQSERLRVAAQDPRKQIEEPPALWNWRHRFEPHQPIEPHMIRRNLRRKP